MDTQVKADWVAALRSGDYTQTTGALRRLEEASFSDGVKPVGYCCLGVLSDLAAKAGVVKEEKGELISSFDGENCMLPVAAVRWAGLPDENPEVPWEDDDGPRTVTIAFLNDYYGLSFEEIADLIEEWL